MRLRAGLLLPAGVLGTFLTAGLVGPLLTGGRERETDLGRSLQPPSAGAWLGTDQLGRDELARLLAGAQGSALAVLVVATSCLVVGGVLGAAAGWRGGLLDRLLLRVADLVTSVPTLLFGLVLAGILGGSALNVAVALGATMWPPYARLVRTETRLRRSDPGGLTLLMLGAGPAHVLARHVLPALLRPVAVLLGITAAEVIVAVATLSYLGLGAQPPSPEWGSMLVESQPYISTAPWLFLAPAVALVAVVASCTLLADGAGRWFSHGVLGGVTDDRPAVAGPPADAEALLAVRGLTVEVGARRVVDGLDLSLAPGRTLAVVGASGSGKTMAMLALLRLFPPTVSARVTGSVVLGGRELVGADEAVLRGVRGGVAAYVPQDVGNALDPLRTAGRQVAAVLRHRGVPARAARPEAVRLLARVGIADPQRVAGQRPGELSGGMRQRVLLACALAGRPRLLVADEPTSALDVTAAAELVELLRSLREETGLATIVVTHELAVAGRLADDLVVLDGGRVAERGPARELLAAPRHPATRRLVEAARHDVAGDAARPAPGELVVTARDVSVRYPGRRPVRALDGVRLEVRAGEVLGVVGNSGCGKSTLARALAGIEPHATGEVLLRGEPVDPRRHGVRLVFQDPSAALDRRQTARAALAEALRLARVPPGAVDEAAEALLHRVGLTAAHGERRPWQLSGGERQRVVIARALVGDPALLVLDEPVSALDSVHRAEVLRVLRDLRAEGRLAMVLVSHDLAAVEDLADRVVVMDAGRIADELTAAGLSGPGGHPTTRALLAARAYFRTHHEAGDVVAATDRRTP